MASGFRRREIANNEVRLGYLDNDGDGPVVVALHGLAGTGDEFIATATAVGGSFRFVLWRSNCAIRYRGSSSSATLASAPLPDCQAQRRGVVSSRYGARAARFCNLRIRNHRAGRSLSGRVMRERWPWPAFPRPSRLSEG